jgi:hypothetical protein
MNGCHPELSEHTSGPWPKGPQASRVTFIDDTAKSDVARRKLEVDLSLKHFES